MQETPVLVIIEVVSVQDPGDATRRGHGQIRVQVRAAAANPMDWKIRRGEMKALSGFRFPRGLGHDFAGVVEAAYAERKIVRPGYDASYLT